mgnify:CR=1 FL=1|jgi:hypothetical protein
MAAKFSADLFMGRREMLYTREQYDIMVNRE